MATPFDGAVSNAEYSVAGRSIEINGLPFQGISEISGGGVTKEGQAPMRGAAGQILSMSRGIKTPQDITIKMTVGSAALLRNTLQTLALTLGYSGELAYMDAPITLVTQWESGNPLAPPFTTSCTCTMNSEIPEQPSTGENFVIALTLKQTTLPRMS